MSYILCHLLILLNQAFLLLLAGFRRVVRRLWPGSDGVCAVPRHSGRNHRRPIAPRARCRQARSQKRLATGRETSRGSLRSGLPPFSSSLPLLQRAASQARSTCTLIRARRRPLRLRSRGVDAQVLLLQSPWLWALAPHLPLTCTKRWSLLFSSAKHGASFRTLSARCDGATRMLHRSA